MQVQHQLRVVDLPQHLGRLVKRREVEVGARPADGARRADHRARLAAEPRDQYVGAKVFFADVDPENGLLTANTLEQALMNAGDRVRAVFPVHINGQTVDMNAIAKRPSAILTTLESPVPA